MSSDSSAVSVQKHGGGKKKTSKKENKKPDDEDKCSTVIAMPASKDLPVKVESEVKPVQEGLSTSRRRRKDKTVKPADTADNKKITDYYQVRRSTRCTETELKKQKQCDLEECVRKGKQDGLEVRNFEDKGRGVVATRQFSRGDFVVEYSGELIELSVAKEREQDYAKEEKGCYIYYFAFKDKNYCIDATEESGLLGRLVNHSCKNFNCATKPIEVDGKPRLILVATRPIKVGEELLYDYGDRSPESLKAHPWLAF